MATNSSEEYFVHDEFNLSSRTAQLSDDQNLKLNNTNNLNSMNNAGNMGDKNEGEDLNQANNFFLESNTKTKPEENNSATQDGNQVEKKGFSWQFSDNVKRDSFGFILRTDALPSDKTKNPDNNDVNNADPNNVKSDKKGKNGKGDDKYEDGKKSDRDRMRERDRDKRRERDRSPHGHKRKYSRSPSPRRTHRRSRSRSRTPRDPRLRRNANNSSDRYRYRRYSSEKSPEKDTDNSDIRTSSPRRERSRTPPMGWRVGHGRPGPVDPRNPPVNIINNMNRQDYVPMVQPGFHSGANPVPPPTNNSPVTLPPVPESNAFNRYQPNNAAPVQVPPPQYNYPPATGTSGSESYPGYDVYYAGYPPPPPPPAHPQSEYAPPAANNWQRDVNLPGNTSTGPVTTEDPAKKEAIEKELLQQKLTLSKQRDEYLRKGVILNRELELLKTQKKELSGDKTRDSEKLLKENNKLQLEINTKIKAVDNVIDILTGIIGDARPTISLEEKVESGKASGRESSREKEKSGTRERTEKKRGGKKSQESSGSDDPSSSEDSSSDSNSDYRKKVRKSKKKKRRKTEANDENLAPPGTELLLPLSESRKEESKPVCNFIYYDPEMHWCQVCDEFPRTAKEYLNHLHSKEHKELTQEKKVNDMPWHDLNVHEEIQYYEGAPTKRIPIKGLQFLVSATAWFCKLCRIWIGDLHCASLHLKSKEHSVNYSSFSEQNPHWETDWMANREKAYEKCAEQRRRQRDEELLQKQKQERMEFMKKQEEELKQKFFSSLMKVPESTESELIMPLTLPRSFESSSLSLKENLEGKKEKEKKKKNKKEKKKKEKRMKEKKKRSKEKKSRKSSSSESGSSSDSSTESSDSEEEKRFKKDILSDLEGRSKSIRVAMRNKERSDEESVQLLQAPPPPPPPLPIPITLPEKSKWEMDDITENKSVLAPDIKERKEVKEQSVRGEPQTENKVVKEWTKTGVSEPEKEYSRHAKEKTKSRDRPRERDWGKDDDRSSRYDKKRNYRDKRQESSRRERRLSWDRKKDYRSSRHRRSRTRSRSRSNSREREREKVTPGVIPAPLYELFKLPEKHGTSLTDSKSERSEDMIPETDDGESKFEKQAMEAAAKKKKVQPVVNLPKSKFGFIGRMPFAKKRSEEKGKKDDDSPKKEDAELEAPPPPRITQPRPPSPKTAKPVLTNKTKVETAKEIVSKYQKAFQEKVEESMPIDPVIMKVEVTNPPLPPSPPVLTMMPPSPPKIRESPKSPKKGKKSPYPLPKDFQDALSIIYPEEKPEDKTEGYPSAEMLAGTLSFQPPSMAYAGQMMMAYPGMHMMAPMPQMPPGPPTHMMNMFGQAVPAPPPPSSEFSRETPSPSIPPPPENLFETSFGLGSSTGVGIPGLEEDRMETSSKMSDDDMALLGIDAEDMAAQQL